MTKIIALAISVVLHVVVITSLALPESNNVDSKSVIIKLKALPKSEIIEKEPVKKEEFKQEIKSQPQVPKSVSKAVTGKQTPSKEEMIPENKSVDFAINSTIDKPGSGSASNDSDSLDEKQNDIVEQTESPSVDTVDIDAVRNAYQQSILTRIDKAKKYPLMARRKEKEGSVVVEFTLHYDGSVSDIAVIEKALFSSFNDAATNAVSSASPFEPIPVVLGISKMRVSVRLTFQLNQ